MSQFKDLFSTQSSDYAKYRPTYPKELFKYLSELSTFKDIAWDCGTGNGQAAIVLTEYFKEVIATDPSQKQLDQAALHERIRYSVAGAENFSNAKDQSIDLVTVAQAFHWFNHGAFSSVLKQYVKPGGHLAVWSYAISDITPEINQAVSKLYSEQLDGYWEKERSHVEDGYKNISMPFKEVETPSFHLSANWSLGHLIGYLSTWSALQTYIKKNGNNPLEDEYENIKKAWGNQEIRTITWPLNLRVWKI